MDQTWTVRAAGVRQRHIDQAQSVNLYITNDYTMRQLLNLYILPGRRRKTSTMCAASLWRWRSARAVPVKLLLKGIESM